MTAIAIPRPHRTVTAFYRLAPHPTPDAAGFARWSARASRAIAGGRVGWLI